MFLDLCENSISLAGGESDRSNSGGGSGSNGYVNIVWAVDFNAALRERQLLRAAEASMRPNYRGRANHPMYVCRIVGAAGGVSDRLQLLRDEDEQLERPNIKRRRTGDPSL